MKRMVIDTNVFQSFHFKYADDDNSFIKVSRPILITDYCDVEVPCKPSTGNSSVKLYLNETEVKFDNKSSTPIFIF